MLFILDKKQVFITGQAFTPHIFDGLIDTNYRYLLYFIFIVEKYVPTIG